MSSPTLVRAFAVMEFLMGRIDGAALGEIADVLALPKSAAHRTLAELINLGYVHQDAQQGAYRLSLKPLTQALRHIGMIPLVDLAKPELERLAELSGELARLSIVEGDLLVWVAKHQGARHGLRYDPDDGRIVMLSHTASGLAWLSTLPVDRAVALIEQQGLEDVAAYGPRAPTTLDEVLHRLEEARERGWCYADSTFELGTATLAAPIVKEDDSAVGVLAVTGPSIRLTASRAEEFAPRLFESCRQLAELVPAQSTREETVSPASLARGLVS